MEISSKTNDDEPKPDKGTACIKSAIVRRLSEIENYFNTTNDTNLVCGILFSQTSGNQGKYIFRFDSFYCFKHP